MQRRDRLLRSYKRAFLDHQNPIRPRRKDRERGRERRRGQTKSRRHDYEEEEIRKLLVGEAREK